MPKFFCIALFLQLNYPLTRLAKLLPPFVNDDSHKKVAKTEPGSNLSTGQSLTGNVTNTSDHFNVASKHQIMPAKAPQETLEQRPRPSAVNQPVRMRPNTGLNTDARQSNAAMLNQLLGQPASSFQVQSQASTFQPVVNPARNSGAPFALARPVPQFNSNSQFYQPAFPSGTAVRQPASLLQPPPQAQPSAAQPFDPFGPSPFQGKLKMCLSCRKVYGVVRRHHLPPLWPCSNHVYFST